MSRLLTPPPVNQDGVPRWLWEVYRSIDQLDRFLVTDLSATQVITPEMGGLVFVANTTAITLTLPKCANLGKGFSYLFIKSTSDAEIVTLDGNGAETINGSATNTSIDAQYDRIGIVTDGSNWFIYSRFIT